MPGPFSLITGGLLGEQDPADQMEQEANAQQAQNRAAIGLDANGNPLPAAGSSNQAAAQAQASGTLPSSQEPNATKTPESLGATMMKLARYEQRQQGFNQALGAGFAAISQPRDRGWVSGMFNVQPLDAARLAQTQMNLASQQQGQDRANMVMRLVNDPTQGPLIAQAFGMDWNGLKAGVMADPGLVAKIAETWGTADERVRAGAQVGHGALGGAGGLGGGLTPGQVGDIKTGIVSGIGGPDNQAMDQAQAAWDTKHPGQPTPWTRNSLADFKLYTDKQQELQQSAAEFGKTNGLNFDKVATFQNRVEALKSNPGVQEILKSPNVYKNALNWLKANPDATQTQIANSLPNWAGYPPEVKQALAEIQEVRSQDYAQAMHSIGQRFSTQEVSNVSKGVDQLLNIELSPDDYNKQLDNLIEDTKSLRGNAYGAAQEFDTMPSDLRPYVNPTFTKGGRRNVTDSGSEDWADSVKATPEEEAQAAKEIASGKSRYEVGRWFRQHGVRLKEF